MSNLGKFQDIVVAAKKAGGVDSLIKNIADAAVAKAAPRIFLKGVGMATAIIAVAASTYKVTKVKLHNRTARGADAEAELRAALAEREDSTHVEPRYDEDGSDPG